jgi:anti-sigma regulatory factor (Ser/Thr protein kinase)
VVDFHRHFRRDLPEVPAARRYVSEVVESQGWIPTDDLLLTVSELVTNAVRHGAGGMEVRVEVGHGVARVEVLDEGGQRVAEPSAVLRVEAVGGRGLHLVRSVAQAWGSGLDARGRTSVWAEVPVHSDVRSLSR